MANRVRTVTVRDSPLFALHCPAPAQMILCACPAQRTSKEKMVSAVLEYLPRGNTLSDEAWSKRHLLLQWVLLLHVPALFLFGVLRGYRVQDVAAAVAVPFALLLVSRLMRTRRLASFFITAGLSFCSAVLVGLS